MIFACGRCRTRYKLPDEKILGRILKVRCKSCGAVIVVRDPALVAQAARSPSATEAEWFVAIRGRQHGPMSLAALVTLAQDETVGQDNYAWRPGMEEWLKVRHIDELNQLLSVAAAPPIPAAAEPEPPEPEPPAPVSDPVAAPAPVAAPPEPDEAEAPKAVAPDPAGEDLKATVVEETPERPSEADTRLEAPAEPAEESGAPNAGEPPPASETATSADALAAPIVESPITFKAPAPVADIGALLNQDLSRPAGDQDATEVDPVRPAHDMAPTVEDPSRPPEDALKTDEDLVIPIEDVVPVENDEVPPIPEPAGPTAEPASPSGRSAPSGRSLRSLCSSSPDPHLDPAAESVSDEAQTEAEAAVEPPSGTEIDAPAALEADTEQEPAPPETEPPLSETEPPPPATEPAPAATEPPSLEAEPPAAEAEPPPGAIEPAPPETEPSPGVIDGLPVAEGVGEKAVDNHHSVVPGAFGAGDDIMSIIDKPSRAEMKTLRQEFSVISKLEATKRQRMINFALVAIGVGLLVAGAMVTNNIMQKGVAKMDFTAKRAAPEVKRGMYEVSGEEQTPAAPGGVMTRRRGLPSEPPAEPAASTPEPQAAKRKSTRSQPRATSKVKEVDVKAKKEAEHVTKMKKMSATEFAKLSSAHSGKAEVKLPTSSKTLAQRKPAKKASDGPKTFSDRAKNITRAIAKKRGLLKTCTTGKDEKVKVTFTIAVTGKVTNVRIKGTTNDRKKSCIANVFWRSIFPKGEQSETFSLPFTI